MRFKYLLLGIVLLILYMLPYIILGENSFVYIHDFFDQNVPIIVDLKNNDLLSQFTGTVPNMEGLDRSLFPFFTPFDIKMVSYYFLPAYWAFVVYTFIYKVLAFCGLFFLLDNYLFDKKNRLITALLSAGFALIPFYSEHALNEAGFPLILFAFLNLYNNKSKVFSYTIIFVYSFNTTLAYGGFFLLVLLCVATIYDIVVRKNKLSKNVFYGAVFMCVIYLVANCGTIYSLFFSDSFVSHRTEWKHTSSLLEDVQSFVQLIFTCQHDVGRLLAVPILLLYIYFFVRYRNKYNCLNFIGLLCLTIIIGIIVGMLLKRTGVQLFITIQLDRFYFFYPGVVFLMLSSMCYVVISEEHKKWLPLFLIYGLLCGPIFDTPERQNLRISKLDVPTYKQFYDNSLFSSIQQDLGIKPDYKTKVVSIGMYPSVAEVNGFYTIDAYRVNYPLDFKHKFRKIIEKELDKNLELKSYFDDWGSRCYIFSSEIGRSYLISRESEIKIKKLELNTNALKSLGCEYVFSSIDILNYKDIGLIFLNTYSTPESFYSIRVYKLM